MTTRHDYALHAAMCCVWGDWLAAACAMDDAYNAVQHDDSIETPQEWAQIRQGYSVFCARLWARHRREF